MTDSSQIRGVLEQSGYTVSATNCCGKGEEVIRSKVVDLILFDITTPGTDGFQYLKKVPKPLRSRTIITAPRNSLAPLGLVEQLTRCNGAKGAMLKPIGRTPLLKLIEQTLAT